MKTAEKDLCIYRERCLDREVCDGKGNITRSGGYYAKCYEYLSMRDAERMANRKRYVNEVRQR